MKTMTDDQRSAIRALPEAEARLAVKVQRVAGFDISEFADLRPVKQKRKVPVQIQVSTIGDRVKSLTKWTGIKECQRCSTLRNKLNRLSVTLVRDGIEGYAADLLSNFVALANGEAVDLSWWDRKYAQAVTKSALLIEGEDNILARCRAVILQACSEEEASLGSGLPVVGSDRVGVRPVEVQNSSHLPSVGVINGGSRDGLSGREQSDPERSMYGERKGSVDGVDERTAQPT